MVWVFVELRTRVHMPQIDTVWKHVNETNLIVCMLNIDEFSQLVQHKLSI